MARFSNFLLNVKAYEDNHYIEAATHYPNSRYERNLTDARRSSQVCRPWQDIVLGSPLMWAQLDWSMFQQKTDDWLNEVVRLSGSCYLHITADSLGNGDKLQSFVSLLDTQWDRIQTLYILLWDTKEGSQIALDIYKKFTRPAMHLRSLFILFRDRFVLDNQPVLFSNQAPSLQELQLNWANFTFNVQASWLPNVRTVHISDGTQLDVRKLLDGHSNMSPLEHLEIRDCLLVGHEDFNGQGLEINLPELHYIAIHDPLYGACAAILDAIVPHPDCIFHWSSLKNFAEDWDYSSENFQRLSQTFRSISE
ncbi:hypothetical protein CPB84DRAFT_1842488 [Gymnopilus junonius]|uniref:Uncharacterized protein n=1 Tax=Gymnopilus junonius TaxID=109634 RepID=A0A9P5NVW3_GYMJU|nr:hypothetical protein CPB84DRAFT_1842488 [Gymnopilus junonius]